MYSFSLNYSCALRYQIILFSRTIVQPAIVWSITLWFSFSRKWWYEPEDWYQSLNNSNCIYNKPSHIFTDETHFSYYLKWVSCLFSLFSVIRIYSRVVNVIRAVGLAHCSLRSENSFNLDFFIFWVPKNPRIWDKLSWNKWINKIFWGNLICNFGLVLFPFQYDCFAYKLAISFRNPKSRSLMS